MRILLDGGASQYDYCRFCMSPSLHGIPPQLYTSGNPHMTHRIAENLDPLPTSPYFSQPLATTFLCSVSRALPSVFRFHIYDIMQDSTFPLRLISCSIIPSKSIHVVANAGLLSSSWLNHILLYVHDMVFVHSPFDGHVGLFHVSATVNSSQ